ncbi:MAG: hypothetical protein H0W18_11265 [Acidobacteria bacterium]|nr:hypothetical protein [Acidobacteriota bacterium]
MVTLRSRYLLVLISIFVALATAAPGYAQSAENVAVVINESSPASVRIGEYYIRKRGIPAGREYPPRDVVVGRGLVDDGTHEARGRGSRRGPVAALLHHLLAAPAGARVVAVLSGGNVNLDQLKGLRRN